MSRISSKKYLAGSRGQQCSLRIPGVCTGDTSTVVPAHIRDGNKGTGNKASDISVANACHACHMVFDGQAKMPSGDIIPYDVWAFYALRGLQETLEQRFEAGLLIVPVDAEVPPMERAVKPRKPRDQRKKIPNRPMRRRKDV
jgi:hypothetical protein